MLRSFDINCLFDYHWFFTMKGGFVLKVILFIYLLVSIYYSENNVFEESSADVVVIMNSIGSLTYRFHLEQVRKYVSTTALCLPICGMSVIFTLIHHTRIIPFIQRKQ